MHLDRSSQKQPSTGEPEGASWRRQRDGGYLLLAILLMMAMMIIALTIVAPRVVQQIKRDREEEMIHRGTEYARAIKKYYKKFGSYPSTLEQLDTTNQIRFLRKRYKDPLTKDGKWKLLNYGDIATLLNAAAPGTSAAALAAQNGLTPGGAVVPGVPSASGGAFSSSQQQQSTLFGSGISASSSQGNQDPNIIYPQNSNNQGVGLQAGQANSGQSESGSQQGGSLFGQSGGASGSNPNGGSNPASNSPFAQNTTGGTQTFGGGAIVGVASLSKDPTIRIYNKKKTYNEWQFIYNPMMDVQNVLLRGPYQPTTIGGAQIGTPAGQMNGQQQGAFGQQQNGLGQQQNGFGQQQNGFGQQQNGFGQQPQTPPGGTLPQQQNQPQ